MSKARLDWMEKEIRKVVRKSRKECGDRLEQTNRLLVQALTPVLSSYIECCYAEDGEEPKLEYHNSLAEKAFIELIRLSNQILMLSYCGLYRNAFDNIRHLLEYIVQAVYIDHRHPHAPLQTRIEILREIEDKREYHATRLIDELEVENKDVLRREYKRLSRIIHPTHEQVLQTIIDFKRSREKGGPFVVDCEKIGRIHDSMKRMFEIFYFLFIPRYPEVKEALQSNHEFIKLIKDYNLVLLSEAFHIKLKKPPK